MLRMVLVFAIVCPWLAAAPASAQPWQGRVLLGVNVAMPASSSTFDDSFTYAHPYSANIPGEEASVETTYETPTAAMFDGGVLVRVFGNLAAGVAFYQASGTNDLNITARIPHPLFIGRHRTVEGATPADYEETGIHVNAAYVIPASRRLYVALTGGPTYFTVTQRVARTVGVSESYPYDEASFVSADVEVLDQSGWGFNAGVDVGWMFNKTFGVGGLLRYSAATLSLAPAGRDPLDIDVGGVHAAVGARVAF